MNEERGSGFLLGMLAGTILGAAVAVLLTPTTGEEARGFIREKVYEPTKDKLMGVAEDIRVKAVDLAEDAKRQASGLARQFKERTVETWEKANKNNR